MSGYWAEGTNTFDIWIADAEVARIMGDACLKARRVLLRAGASPTHPLCVDLDMKAARWAHRYDQAYRTIHAYSVTCSLIALYGGDPT